jgi:hypothetical protein
MLLSGWARAAGLRVAIVRAKDASSLVRHATTCLRAELRAAGFDAVEVPAATEEDARDVIEEAGEGAGAFAALYLRPVANRPAIDVWIADSMTLKTSVRRIDVAAQKRGVASRAIALHAIELLRASLLEVRRRPQSETVRAQPAYDSEAHAYR